MSDTIYRQDAIKAIHSYWKDELSKMPTTNSEYGEVIDGDCDILLKHNKELSTLIKAIPSADRSQGDSVSRRYLIAEIDDLANDSQVLVKDLVDDEFNPYDEECMRCKHLKLKCEFIPTYCRFEPIEHIEPKHGEWIYTNNPLRLDDEWACSRCGNISFVKTNFCDRCGAGMRKESE